MKKVLLLLALLIGVTSFVGCDKDKYYTNYSMGVNGWSGDDKEIHEKAAQYLIASGYVSQFQLEGGASLEEHNAEALVTYNSKLKHLKESGLAEIAAKLKGSNNAPFTLSFNFLINQSAGVSWALLKSERVSVEIEK